ncbi:MAG: hypothetical protein OEY19_02020 [Gammaproteobacteria bacterium]|nr:hypothetical protein [Gammaproteobacteria bacterium]MDH5628747.1 hypothetical protein [Gammaproteobacteria bacterium]
MIKKLLSWQKDIAYTALVIFLFAIIDSRIEALKGVVYYYDFLMTAKWLLIGGFSIMAIYHYFFDS